MPTSSGNPGATRPQLFDLVGHGLDLCPRPLALGLEGGDLVAIQNDLAACQVALLLQASVLLSARFKRRCAYSIVCPALTARDGTSWARRDDMRRYAGQ
jgi:hypothetical protein